ncbi:hypothetical protein D9M72_604030 [compost metagenome]
MRAGAMGDAPYDNSRSDEKSAPWHSGWSRMAYTMVGTRKLKEARCACSAAMYFSGSNPRCRMMVPPRHSVGTSIAPAPCEMGVGHSRRNSAGSWRAASRSTACIHIERLVSMTPFGLPVVPPV